MRRLFALLFALAAFTSCDDGPTLVCLPNLYRCGGDGGNLVQRCDSTTERWEDLRDCEAEGLACEQGRCVSLTDGDADAETEGEAEAPDRTCARDIDCSEPSICSGGECRQGVERVRWDLRSPGATLVYRQDQGRAAVFGASGTWRVEGIFARIFEIDTGIVGWRTDDDRPRTVTESGWSDAAGEARELVIAVGDGDGEPILVWRVAAYENVDEFRFTLQATAPDAPLTLTTLDPFATDDEGGLFIQTSRESVRVVGNNVGDDMDQVSYGDGSGDSLAFQVVAAPRAGFAFALGQAGPEAGATTVVGKAPQEAQDGNGTATRIGGLAVRVEGAPHAEYSSTRRLEAGHVLNLSPAVLAVAADFEDALSIYAWSAARTFDLDPDIAPSVRSFWNAGGGDGTGTGYGPSIDEATLAQNLDILVAELVEWGLEGVVLPHWSSGSGDWTWDAARFPNGPEAAMASIRAAGLKSGLVAAPLAVDPQSQVAQDHPDWLAERYAEPDDGGGALLDPTNAEAAAALEANLRTARESWGVDFVALDFAPWMLSGKRFADAETTGLDAYRRGVAIVRETMSGAPLIALGGFAAHLGLVEAVRVAAANEASWFVGEEGKTLGIVDVAATAARRTALNGVLGSNIAGELIFKRPPANGIDPLTIGQAQAWASFLALTGGAIALADRLPDLAADELNAIRRVLPVYGVAARPVDGAKRAVPEVWRLRIDRQTDGFDEPYDVVGLFSWGRNLDLTTSPPMEILDGSQPRIFDLDLRALGMLDDAPYLAYEFWTETFLGAIDRRFSVNVPPTQARVVALRQATGIPQFVGFNRHILMGARRLTASQWNAEAKRLTLNLQLEAPTPRAPFTHRLYAYVPEGYLFQDADYAGALAVRDAVYDAERRLVTVSLVPAQTGPVIVELEFAAE